MYIEITLQINPLHNSFCTFILRWLWWLKTAKFWLLSKQSMWSRHRILHFSAEQKDDEANKEDYYSFDQNIPGIQIHEIWDYIRQHKSMKFRELVQEFDVLLLGCLIIKDLPFTHFFVIHYVVKRRIVIFIMAIESYECNDVSHLKGFFF